MKNDSDDVSDYSEEEIKLAEEKIDAYLAAVLRIYERINTDPTSAILLSQLLKQLKGK